MKKYDAVVFVGPSLPYAEIERLASNDIKISPPVKRGDLAKHMDTEIFLIVDGEFDQTLSVTPKEILSALDSGKKVVGASSMGALRASELYCYGMFGIGWVYEYFMNSKVRDDEAVAMTYMPELYIPITIPHVNIEYWSQQLLLFGNIDIVEANLIRKTSKKIFFADRTEYNFLSRLSKILGTSKVTDLLAAYDGKIPDIKAIDARLALSTFINI
jgi:TfuA protein